ncbi:MAG: TIGR03086 family protein, partial [Actinomycetota bacterium]
WADDAVLGRDLTLPFAVVPGAIALSIYIGELTIHTWDLAVAIGADVVWDDDVVDGAVVAITTGLPAEPRGDEVGIPFDPVVPTAQDAPAIDRLVAWTGRDPSWTPAAG